MEAHLKKDFRTYKKNTIIKVDRNLYKWLKENGYLTTETKEKKIKNVELKVLTTKNKK